MSPEHDLPNGAEQRQRVTSRDVAAAAGVHQSTVSRVLNGDQRISNNTRKRVEATAEQLGYVPSKRAQNLRTRRSGVVGVMVHDIDNAFYLSLLSDMHRELSAVGYSIVLIVDPLHRRSDISRMRHLFDDSLDGMLITTAMIDSEIPPALRARGMPLVLAVRSMPDLDVDTVESDNVAAGREAARHLVALGHTDIAVAMGPKETSTTRDRLRGVLDVIQTELPPDRVMHGPYRHETGYAMCRRLMMGERPPTAIIAGNDVMAIGVLDSAWRTGLSTPEDLSVLGFDDIPMAAWQAINLTTVRQDSKAIAEQAARRLVDRIDQPDSPPHHDIFPVSLTGRATTGPPRAKHPRN
ncbi:MAG: LacI family transcriptional regulator [Acidimicrobiales bacterium]|nr:LacI family transcriptional regulator [Acidimicrobiales bacterium]